MSGGISGEQLLPMALAIGATAASGGALAPAALGGSLGLGTGIGAAVGGGALMGAGTGALSAALTGGDIGKSALYGGVGGGASAGIVGAAGMPSGAAADVAGNAGMDVGGFTANGLPPSPMPIDALGHAPASPSMPFEGPFTSSQPMPSATGMPTQAPFTSSGNSFLSGGVSADGAPSIIDSANSVNQPYKYNPTSMLGRNASAIGGGLAAGFAQQQPTMPTPGGDSVPDAINYKFDRNTYRPSVAPYYNGIASLYPQNPYAQQNMGYADGGTVEQMSRDNSLGGNQMFPQSGINSLTGANRFQNATNTPMGTDVVMPTDYQGQQGFASGGITDLGSYSDGGRLLKGPGTGISDDIPATIGNKQPARLADGEFVVPSRIVSEIGQGSTEAGARELYKMMDRVQSARKKTVGKGKFARNSSANKHLPA